MRYSKYIEAAMGLFTTVSWVIYISEPTMLRAVILASFICTDLLVTLGFSMYAWIRLKQEKLVLIRQKGSPWDNNLINLSLLAMLLIVLYIFFWRQTSLLATKIGMVIILYALLKARLINGKKRVFYLDKIGLIQANILKKDYPWGELREPRIENDSICFQLEKKNISLKIDTATKIRIAALMPKEGLHKQHPKT